MKLRTQKDGCLQINQNSRAPVDMKLRTQKDGCLQKSYSVVKRAKFRQAFLLWLMADYLALL
jgi:hypothetical protein